MIGARFGCTFVGFCDSIRFMISPEIHHTWADVGYALVSNPLPVGMVGAAFAVSVLVLSVAIAMRIESK